MPRDIRLRRWLTTALVAVFASLTVPAWAGPDDVVLLPTNVDPSDLEQTPSLSRWASHLDTILSEAVQDLGLTLDLSARRDVDAEALSDAALVARASEHWVISPRLAVGPAGKLELRIVAVAPGSRVLLIRSEPVTPDEFEVRLLNMVRDLVQAGRRTPAREPELSPAGPDPRAVASRARSEGRAILALNGAALGGYVGYSLQRAGGSDDARLTYPLIALGVGVGLGGSLIIADEWDVGLGDAWYLTAGAAWPLAAGLLLAKSYDVDDDQRPAYGLLGATAGLTLATIPLAFEDMSEGGAVLAHSGGAFGLVLGGLGQLIYEARTDVTPTRGMGYGAALGVVAGGALATQWKPPASRVLLIDLAASLGALVGAAAASPVLFVEDDTDEWQPRVWLASAGVGTLAGGALGFWFTRPSGDATTEPTPAAVHCNPFIGVVAPGLDDEPALGAGVRGIW